MRSEFCTEPVYLFIPFDAIPTKALHGYKPKNTTSCWYGEATNKYMFVAGRFKKCLGSHSTGSIRSRRGQREGVSPAAGIDRVCVTPTFPTECSQLTQYNVVPLLFRFLYLIIGAEWSRVLELAIQELK